MIVSVVIPTYNERENLPILIDRLMITFREHNINGNIIVVDDGSPDGTGDIADEISNKIQNVYVIHRQGKLGIGSAYIAGIEYAIEKIFSDIIFTMDSDLSHDPDCIPNFIDLCSKGFDVVVGSRYIEGGGVENWPFYRRFISRGANLFAGSILGVKVHDMTTGYRCYKKKVIMSIDLKTIKSNGYSFLEEILYRCVQKNFTIGETPIIFADRKYGNSKLSQSEMFKFIWTILKLKLFK